MLFLRIGLVAALLTPASAFVGGVHAQTFDARTLPAGMIRLGVAGLFTHTDAQLGEGGGRHPIRGLPQTALHSETFAPLAPLEEILNQHFETAPPPEAPEFRATPANLNAGVSRFEFAAERRNVPVTVELGLTGRLSISASVPVVYDGRRAVRWHLADGTLGLNPDTAHNRRVLEAVGGPSEALSTSPVLPTASSDVGTRLQESVRARTGETLRLPTAPLDAQGFRSTGWEGSAIPILPFRAEQDMWRPGDSRLEVRLQLFDSGPTHPFAVPEGGFRAVASAGIRLPTGRASAVDDLLTIPRAVEGVWGASAGGALDYFPGPRTSLSAGVRYEHFGGAGEAGEGDWWDSGSRLELAASPGFRLNDALAFTAQYALERENAVREGEETAGAMRSAHLWGVGATFSTLPHVQREESGVPFEVSLRFLETFAGGGAALDARRVELRGAVFHRLWGGR